MNKKLRHSMTAIVVLALGIGITGGASADPLVNPEEVTVDSWDPHLDSLLDTAPGMSDADLDQLVRALESLPDDLKNADPQTTPNYEERINQALGGMAFVGTTRGFVIQRNWWACAREVGTLIFEYAVPVGKVLRWLRTARRLWGGVAGIYRAITLGYAAAQIGPEAAELLGALLGYDGVVNACLR